MSCSWRRASTAWISSSRSRTSSRYSGGRTIMYTIVPTNGKMKAATVAVAISSGSAMRRRASANVYQTSASQTTTRPRTSSLNAVSSALLSTPKTAGGTMSAEGYPPGLQEESPEEVPDREEDEDDERDDRRHRADHREDRRAVVGLAEAPGAAAGRPAGAHRTRSATR